MSETILTPEAAAPVVDPVTPETAAPVVDPVTEPATTEPETTDAPAEVSAEAFTFPEGAQVDMEVAKEYAELAKSLGLTQEQAQGQIGFYQKAQEQMIAKVSEQWSAQSKADKEFGGDKFDENLAIASKAIDAFATPELKGLLNSTGLGNNPDMIRAFYRAGLLLKEDSVVTGEVAVTKTNDPKLLYPNSNLN